MADYTLDQLINISQLESLLEAHVRIVGIACGLMDNEQNIIIGAGLQQVCTRFLWENPDSFARCWRNDPEIRQALSGFCGDRYECRCKNGMVNIAMPIMIDGKRLGLFFSGQFFYDHEPPDLGWFHSQAQQLGFDVEPYLAAVRQTPLFSRSQIDATMGFLHQLVQLLAETGYTNLMRLRELEERERLNRELLLLSTAINSSTDAFYLIDEQLRCVYVNNAACRTLGYSREELLTMTPLDVDPTLTLETAMELTERVYLDGAISSLESYHRTKDGRVFPVELNATFFECNGARFSLTIAHDISKRKQAEQQITLLNHALDQVREGVFLKDLQKGGFLYVNQEACRSLGYSRDELLGMSALDINPAMTPESFQALGAELKRTGGLTFETVHRSRTGRVFPVEVATTIFTYNGTAYSFALVRDIAERKRIETELTAREQQFRSLAEHIPDNVARWDTAGRFLYSNPVHQRTMGRPLEALVGKTHDEIFPDGRFSSSTTTIVQVATTGAPLLAMRQSIPAEDGITRIHDISFVPEFSETGEVVSVLGLGRDMTDIYLLQEAIDKRECEFRTLAENLPDNIVRYDSRCRMIYVNPRLEKTLGLPAAVLLGKMPTDRPSGMERVKYLEKIKQVLQTGEDAEIDLVLSDTGDGKRYHNVRFVAERAADGTVSGVLAIGRDITEHKRVEQERLANLYFLSCMERVNHAIQQTNNLEQVMSTVLDIVLSIFDCDRAYLLYPGTPDAEAWQIPVERTTAAYPGLQQLELPASENGWIAKKLRLLLYTAGPLRLGAGTPFPLTGELVEQLGIQNIMAMAIYPRVGQPWEFGIHQCSHQRVWSPAEKRLFQEIGRRLADAMTSLLIQRDLQESEARYRLVFENSPVSLWEEDFSGVKELFDQLRSEGVEDLEACFEQQPELIAACAEKVRIIDINRAALVLHDARYKQELLDGLIKTFTPESLAVFRKELVSLWQGKTQLQFDSVVKTLAGEARQVTAYVTVCPGYEATLAKCLVSLVDITDRKMTEEKLREKQQRLHDMAMELTISEERERRRLAVDLHDTLGQDLMLTRMKLGGLNKTAISAEQRTLLGDIGSLTEHSISRVRRLTKLLCPPVLDVAGLEAALKWLARQIETDYLLHIAFHDDLQEKTVSRTFQIELYSSVRELLINVAKHADTETVCLSLTREADLLVIRVEDDGVGFDAGNLLQHQHAGGGFGLFTIKHRILNMGGVFEIISEPGKGTEVTIKVPLVPWNR